MPVNTTDYLCTTNQYFGYEKVIEFTNPALADVTFELTSLPGGSDLDLIVLKEGACSEYTCLAGPGDL